LEAAGTANVPARIPEDFPKDFPVYKDAAVRTYGPMVPANPVLGTILVLQTSDSKQAVLEFYRRELPVGGWILEKPLTDCPDSLTAHKDNRRISVSVLDSRAGEKRATLIQLGVNGSQ
jgi:hypothetical protein